MPNRSKSGLRAAALGLLLLSLGACKSDGDGIFSGLSVSNAANSPPTIAGTPKTTAVAGQSYVFQPRASDPDGQALTFSIRNQPQWATFDGSTGRLSGRPAPSNVGIVSGIEISVSDGTARRSVGPFDIRVDASGVVPAPVPGPSPVPSTPGAFQFAEIPEIVFVRGYAETEHMGIFHVDTQNRWTPGDLENRSGWMPEIATEMRIVSGSISGVSYDSRTGVLSYDGSGSGSETATVTLVATSEDAVSNAFNVRVLKPTIAWGVDAARRFPGIGYDSTTTPWMEMQRNMMTAAPYEAPNVLLVTPGIYDDDYFTSNDRLNIYILGEPGSQPKFVGDNINLDKVETAYLKNLELQDTIVNSGGDLEGHDVRFYITKVYQHDSTRDANGFKASPGSPVAGSSWHYWFWNFHGSQMGWKSNLRHQMYIEGRLDSHLHVNNIRITGSRESSSIKCTRPFVRIRNSYVSAVLDEGNLALGMRSDKVLDLASAAEIVVYNNELVGAFAKDRWGPASGLIFLRARRGMWGADSPAYPDVSWSPPVSSVRLGFAPEGFTAGPETFVNPRFWQAVRSFDIGDPSNPYSFKKYISYNRFRWIDEEDKRQSVFRDDGTAPREAAYQGSSSEIWGTVPEGWTERSVSFFANNAYEGWLAEDVRDPKRWFDLDNHVGPSLVTRVGPGPWPYPPPPRTTVIVGGEVRPDSQQPGISLPTWFKH